jgi:hypothetical protein
MISIALPLLLATLAVDQTVVSTREPRPPERQAVRFEARCGGKTLALNGVGPNRPTSEGPLVEIDRTPVELPPEARAFLSKDRSAYRLFAVCPSDTPAFQLRIYRASGSATGGVAYANYAVDVAADGRVTDRGGSTIDADAFWFR